MHSVFEVRTQGPGLYEFTPDLKSWVAGQEDGLLTLLVQHTSASLLVQENADPDVLRDMQSYLSRLVPRGDSAEMAYLTHVAEGPDDMPAHIKAAMLPVSICVPVQRGKLVLGTWQGIYLFEHRDAPHTRKVAAHFRPD